MPVRQCENGKWAIGPDSPCAFDTKEDAQRALAAAFASGYREKTEMISPFDTELDVLEKRSLPFGSPGGKKRWAPILLEMFPEHDHYVEPYIGGGALFWNKEPCENEVINDLNTGIVGVYRFLQEGSDKDFAWMRRQSFAPNERKFNRLKASTPSTLREQAYRYKYLNVWSIRRAAERFCKLTVQSYGDRGGNAGANFLKNLEKFRERLANVEVRCTDALKVIKENDGPEVFFYLDPPWKVLASSAGWREFDGATYVEAVKAIKGRVLMSYQGDTDLVQADGKWRKKAIELAGAGGFVANAKPSVQDVYFNYAVKAVETDMVATKSFRRFFGM